MRRFQPVPLAVALRISLQIMKHKILAILVLLSATLGAAAQGPGGGFDKERLFFGGNFGLSFSGGYSLINISPQIGYRFNEHIAAGGGVNYIHYGLNDFGTKYTQNYAGLEVFGRVYPIRQFFLQAQPELNYVWGKINYDNNQGTAKIPTQFVPSMLLGGGAAIPAGRGAITISVMYDVVQNSLSPYYHQAVYGFGYISSF